jgi:hypothetical protein
MVRAGLVKFSGEGDLNRSTQATKKKGPARLSDWLRPSMVDGLVKRSSTLPICARLMPAQRITAPAW